MDLLTDIREKCAGHWIPAIYSKKVRSQRTRSYHLDIPERENNAEIQYTLLGIELKVGKRRFACPDLATARYLLVFARIGCHDFAIPYDISKISAIADEFETAWQRSLILVEAITSGKQARNVSLARSKLVRAMRDEITAIGAGEAMPAFDRVTKQSKM